MCNMSDVFHCRRVLCVTSYDTVWWKGLRVSVCGKAFTGQISLKGHVRLHTGHRNLSTVTVVRVSLWNLMWKHTKRLHAVKQQFVVFKSPVMWPVDTAAQPAHLLTQQHNQHTCWHSTTSTPQSSPHNTANSIMQIVWNCSNPFNSCIFCIMYSMPYSSVPQQVCCHKVAG
jgi:hypothetical protein